MGGKQGETGVRWGEENCPWGGGDRGKWGEQTVVMALQAVYVLVLALCWV